MREKRFCDICRVNCWNLARHCETIKHKRQFEWNELCNSNPTIWGNDAVEDMAIITPPPPITWVGSWLGILVNWFKSWLTKIA
jgi:hypothetical protein